MSGQLSTEELLQKLNEQHQAYLETFKLVHEALSRSVAATPASPPLQPSGVPPASAAPKRRRRSTLEIDADRPERPEARKPSTYHSSVLTGESSESDDDDELYVQTPLPAYKYRDEDLRKHLRTYNFSEKGLKLLEGVVWSVLEGVVWSALDPVLFQEYDPSERWHNSHYTIFDVGKDGAPLSRYMVVKPGSSIDQSIWQAIQDLNADPTALRPAVGRISIVREPSSIIFGALHLTMNKDFDMDEIFKHLVEETNSAAHMINRGFKDDPRHQRSFIFKFDYFTVVGEGAQPMPWQRSDTVERLENPPKGHIPISRCSSIVALSLSGNHVKKLKNASRRGRTQYGYVYDPWAPWHVLSIQCYPDYMHSMDSHDSTKHYVNGPEAFLHTLLSEFKDAEKRYEEIYTRITKLITPPTDFMFNGDFRDKLLFEDEEFTYSRRYFWAFQTLGIMNNGIKAMIDAYEDTFTDEVWDGTHKTLWPMLDLDSNRNVYWRKRMASLRKEFQKIIKQLKQLFDENDDRRKEIRTLRDQLFSGTSVLESRKSVELSAVTILQGHNIKLLTLVSIFFLPLTFVTSVFGMTNMPTEHQFKWFGITMATVCIPFFLLIGSLNTTSGMEFWRSKWHQIRDYISHLAAAAAAAVASDKSNGEVEQGQGQGRGQGQGKSRNQQRIERVKQLSLSASSRAMTGLGARTISPATTHPRLDGPATGSRDNNPPRHPPGQENGRRPDVAETNESTGGRTVTLAADDAPKREKPLEQRWWEKVLGRKRRVRGYDV